METGTGNLKDFFFLLTSLSEPSLDHFEKHFVRDFIVWLLGKHFKLHEKDIASQGLAAFFCCLPKGSFSTVCFHVFVKGLLFRRVTENLDPQLVTVIAVAVKHIELPARVKGHVPGDLYAVRSSIDEGSGLLSLSTSLLFTSLYFTD